MSKGQAYADRFSQIVEQTLFRQLPGDERAFLRRQAIEYRFSHQEMRRISEIATDLNMWGEPSITQVWPVAPPDDLPQKQRRVLILAALEGHVEGLRSSPKEYGPAAAAPAPRPYRIRSMKRSQSRLGLGRCPVASERTRCCNLLTLDAVENCGFGCSYCSVQSFYHDGEIHFDSDFGDKLMALELDAAGTYHIGTGQASDSLMWGNRFGVLDALTDFARRHPNVILELKSKSKNVAYLLRNSIPRNLICTWSLNPQCIIDSEEHRTASLNERLDAARRAADRGILVGFHFHPMVHYADWRADYAELFKRVVEEFDPSEVALVSLGTLTFTKSVILAIRSRGARSRILQMPFKPSDGKLSYPREIKVEMFAHAYQALSAWHGRVFFYLCMESHRLWHPVLGFEYPSNQAFEAAMKASYLAKIRGRAPALRG